MNLIRSKYNILFIHNGEYLLYNAETGAFLKLNKFLFSILKSENIPELLNLNENILKYLIEAKVLIDNNTVDDYYYQQKFKFNLERYSQNILSLTILPTINCNCACPYCFEENKESLIMSDDIIDNLLSFISQHENAKILDVCWYGGEPLLGFEVIKKIWNRLDKEVHLELRNHHIITNGYLITDEVIDFFNQHPLSEIQITLDGKKEVHDSRRFLKGSRKGTFDVILANIRKVSNAWKNTHVSVRVNIDNKNKDDFAYLRNLINDWGCENIFVYPGFIRREDSSCNDQECRDLSHGDIQDFYFSLGKENVDVSFFSSRVNRGCAMNAINSYLIGPKGEIYKCWNEVGNATKIVGYIHDDKIKNLSLLSKYMTASSLFEDEKCKECNLFPICSGGCPRRRVNNTFFGGKHDLCSLYKDNDALLKALKCYYESITEKKELKQPLLFK